MLHLYSLDITNYKFDLYFQKEGLAALQEGLVGDSMPIPSELLYQPTIGLQYHFQYQKDQISLAIFAHMMA